MLSRRSPPIVWKKSAPCPPPAKARRRPIQQCFLADLRARSVIVCAGERMPQLVIVAAAASAVAPTIDAGLLIAK